MAMFAHARHPWIAMVVLSMLVAACNNGGQGPAY
jgi:predicted small secreted protein